MYSQCIYEMSRLLHLTISTLAFRVNVLPKALYPQYKPNPAYSEKYSNALSYANALTFRDYPTVTEGLLMSTKENAE